MNRAKGQDILCDTADGRPVPNSQATSISHPLAARALEDAVKLPARLRVRAHPRYNCHGLTFASRRTAVLADTDVQQILDDDRYTVVADKRDVLPGDVAIYFTNDGGIDHSAIVATIPSSPTWIPFVVSKWGVIGPEVYHLATDCPDYAVGRIQYYRCSPR